MGQRLLLVDSDRSFLKEHQVSLEAAFDLELAGAPEGVLAKLETGAFAAVFIDLTDGQRVVAYGRFSEKRLRRELDPERVA